MSADSDIVSPENQESDHVTGQPLRRLIGSQRNPEAYRPKPSIEVQGETALPNQPKTESYPPQGQTQKEPKPLESDDENAVPDRLSAEGEAKLRTVPIAPVGKIQVPKVRNGRLSDDLESELNAMFSGQSVDSLINNAASVAVEETVHEPDTKVKGKILSIRGGSVFVDVGAREQGVVTLNMFPADYEPKIGEELEVTVVRFLSEEGLYELSVPLGAADVRDWSQVRQGMIVEARITKTNNGGLECEVNRLRGFIPISQIDLYRVENTEQYVGQKFNCVVEEVDPERRNLVLSRRSLLLREREELREKTLTELEVGQTREGLVRKIIDAGAFVDLGGGVDGFVPIGALSWGRIRHPGEVLSEGKRITVRIARIDEQTKKISLIYRDDATNPWNNIQERFQEKSQARGKVTKIMDFGAFIELMPGVEGLAHISELSHKRVGSVGEVLKEGEWIDVYIVSIDATSKRISLSLKHLQPMPEPEPKPETADNTGVADDAPPAGKKGKGKVSGEPVAAPVKFKNIQKGPLKGGTGSPSGGEKFGLNW